METYISVCFVRPTFRRILRSQSTEQFSGLPYIYALLNCLICLWYGMPLVSPGIILVATVNSIGVLFQLIYISIFITYAEKPKKVFFFPAFCKVIFDSALLDSAWNYCLWLLFAVEDVWIVNGSFCTLQYHSVCEHKTF